MSKKEMIEQRTEALLLPILEENGFSLWDVEYVREAGEWHLRAYIDKEGGINIDECVLVSRALEKKLDEEDFVPEAYILEISSPGLGRQLKKDRDFEHSLGAEVELKLFAAVNGQKEYEGVLSAYDAKTVTVSFEDDSSEVFERKNISVIRLALDF